MSGGWGRWGESFHPMGLAINKDDLLLVCDTGNNRVQVLSHAKREPRHIFWVQ